MRQREQTHQLGNAERDKEAIGHELDVLLHEGRVHADEVDRQRLGYELLLTANGLGDNSLDLESKLQQAVQIWTRTSFKLTCSADSLVWSIE
jgi:hypothetical protein